MISHQNQCIFLHIPKCAGTSIEMALGHHAESSRGVQDHRSLRMLEEPFPSLASFSSLHNMVESAKRIKYSLVSHSHANNTLSVTPQQYHDYFKFTFVRNPWARLYSWYINVITDKFHQIEYKVDASISFPEFLKRFVGWDSLAPQTYWIKNMKGEVPLDFIGKFENLREDWNEVCKMMGIPYRDLPHETKATVKKKNYREVYDEQSYDLVKHYYREEIELFGYTFENAGDFKPTQQFGYA